MRFDSRELGFHFEMNDNRFVSLTDEGKAKIMGFNETQIKQTPFVFVEVNKEKKLTGRYFSLTLDSGIYPTDEDVKNGQNLNIANMKKTYPNFELISETTIMPNNIRNAVWKLPNETILSQYYMAKNGHMFCVGSTVSKQHDDLDNLMASVCMSVTGENKTDLEREAQQNLMMEITREANRLIDEEGLSTQEAMDKAFEKFGVKRK